jgi:hypothetical protein
VEVLTLVDDRSIGYMSSPIPMPSALNLNEILFLNLPTVCIEPALCLSCQQFPAKAVCQY